LRTRPDALDIWCFDRLVREGRVRADVSEWDAAAAALSEAVHLWRGPPLSDLGEWAPARAEAARLEEELRCVREELAEVELARGHHHDVVVLLETMVSEEPFRERRWRLLMLALYRCGRQADALRAFQRARAALDELGLEPGPELRTLERGISVHDQALGATRSPPASAGRRHNLPLALTRFVGRTSELKEIEKLLGSCRLLSLTGVGGAGKTRLALEAAASAVERYPDGVWLLELAALWDEKAVPFALAAALELRASGGASPDAVEHLLCRLLSGRRVLLIFDNCEHLIGAAARLIHVVLTGCPGVNVLATSRTLLDLPGEVVVAVPPLSLPPSDQTATHELLASDAVALFCERAHAARPPFRLTGANAGAVAGICRRLDGIPLALELAAARVRMLSVNQIFERLGNCLGLLTGGPRTAGPRQQTLRATLDWSYDLLSPDEQAALRRLAAFPASFDLEAAVAVVGTDIDGFELVSRLIDQSLVVVLSAGDQHRYRLLEPIRQYAADKLAEADEVDAARDRHRDFFLNQATASLRSGLPGLAHGRRIFADQANYRIALEWSWQQRNLSAALSLTVAQINTWMWLGDPQGSQWLERVLAEPESLDDPARVYALAEAAIMLHDSRQPDPEREKHLLQEAAALARRLGDVQPIAAIEFGFAEFELAWGHPVEARLHMEAALTAEERFGSMASVGWCHEHLGWVAVAKHDHKRALAHFEQAVELAQTDGRDEFLSAHALAALAPLTALLGDSERGLGLAEEGIRAARGLTVPGVLPMTLVRAGETAILAGRNRRAGEIVAELLQLLQDFGSRRWLADALEMAALVLDSGEAAVEVLGASEALRTASGESCGGSRTISAKIQRCRNRLIADLGPERFAGHNGRGRDLSPEVVVAETLTRLAGPGG
jgi:predicted ATPase